MGFPKFDGYDLNDGVQLITSELPDYLSTPENLIETGKIADSSGSKNLGEEDDDKTINMVGWILTPTASGFLGVVDEFRKKLKVKNKKLEIESGREYTASIDGKVQIPKLHYNQTAVKWRARFLCADPYAYNQIRHSVLGTVASGVGTVTLNTTISGGVFPEPKFIITPTGVGAGESSVDTISIDFIGTTSLTISGSFPYGSDIDIDFENYKVTVSGLNRNYQGSFTDFDIDLEQIKVTTSGGGDPAFNYNFNYQPRYY